MVAPPPTIAAIDPQSLVEGQRGTIAILGKDGRRRGQLTSERSRTYEDGRQRFESVHLKVEQEDPFEIRAGVLETKSKSQTQDGDPDEWTMAGGVVLSTPSGLRIDSDAGTYSDNTGVMTMPGKVTFSRDRMAGSGVGAAYRRDPKTLELLTEAEVTVKPDKTGHDSLFVKSRSMVLNRVEHALHLDGSAEVRMESQTFHAGRAGVFLTDDEQTVKQVRLLGGANVTPATGAKTHTPAMKADAIDLDFHGDGRSVRHATLAAGAVLGLGSDVLKAPWIDMELAADGATVTRLETKEPTHVDLAATPGVGQRSVDSKTLLSTGNAKGGLTTATFAGDVRFVEMPATPSAGVKPLTATSRTLTLALGGGLGAVESADFSNNVTFTDGVVKADADDGRYDAVKDRLVLRTGAAPVKRRPAVEDARFHLDGDLVEINTQTHDMTATGSVATRTIPQSEGEKDRQAPGVFDRSKEILGSATRLDYVSKTGRAIYKGTASQMSRVWQEKNSVTGEEITLEDATQNLSARRRVETVLQMTPAGAAATAKPVSYRIRSAALDFDQASRRAVFTGDLAELKTPEETAEGKTLEFRLGAESSTIDGFTLTGRVWAQLPEGREADGERLTFDAKTQIYTLAGSKGAAARVKSPGPPGEPCRLSTGMGFEMDQRNNSFRSTVAGPVGDTVSIPCDKPLKSIPR
jgi:lipopolysaccharide export system protein LptA